MGNRDSDTFWRCEEDDVPLPVRLALVGALPTLPFATISCCGCWASTFDIRLSREDHPTDRRYDVKSVAVYRFHAIFEMLPN
jgi:hypothetical protein